MRRIVQSGWGALLFFLWGLLSLYGQAPRFSSAPGAPDSTRLKQFETRYQAAKSLQATFLEQYLENGKLVRSEAGTVFFERPGKMRWDYQRPEPNTFLVDGKYVWFYAPADHTATRMPVKQSADYRTPLAFLAGGSKLARVCSQVGVAEAERAARAEDVTFECQLRGPKASNGIDRAVDKAYFQVAPSGELVRLVILQEGAVRIELSFKDWEWDPRLPESLFEFVPPRGSVIVEGQLPEPL